MNFFSKRILISHNVCNWFLKVLIVVDDFKALIKEDLLNKRAQKILKMDERKRPYNSMQEVKAPTEEEMEAYRMKRLRTDDPMAHFLS